MSDIKVNGYNNLLTAVRGLRHFYDTTNPDFEPDEQEKKELHHYIVMAVDALCEMEQDDE